MYYADDDDVNKNVDRDKADVFKKCKTFGILFNNGWRRSVVVSGVGLINEVNQHRARLALGWVAASGRVNHLGI